MTNYKGYYIDHIYFHSKAEIDNFIKEQAIETYRRMCRKFVNSTSMELNALMCAQSDRLHNVFGLGYDEIENIEIEAMAAA